MPFTPIHFGPGAALHALAPRYISFWAFCAANVLIDIEPLYHLIKGSMRLHQQWHSYLGASAVWIATILLFSLLRGLCQLIRLPNWFRWQQLALRAVVIGAALGSYSHVLLDSLMHFDMQPFWPFHSENGLLHQIDPGILQIGCLVLGIIGLLILAIRSEIEEQRR